MLACNKPVYTDKKGNYNSRKLNELSLDELSLLPGAIIQISSPNRTGVILSVDKTRLSCMVKNISCVTATSKEIAHKDVMHFENIAELALYPVSIGSRARILSGVHRGQLAEIISYDIRQFTAVVLLQSSIKESHSDIVDLSTLALLAAI